jgi:hypothetical protein
MKMSHCVHLLDGPFADVVVQQDKPPEPLLDAVGALYGPPLLQPLASSAHLRLARVVYQLEYGERVWRGLRRLHVWHYRCVKRPAR